MESFLAALEATGPAQYLRASRWGYAAVNGAHILGIALLVGAMLPLNLRLLGLWRSVPQAELIRVLVPAAIAGFALAAITGFLLFSVKAQDYADIGFFRLKLALILLGVLSAAMLHRGYGLHAPRREPVAGEMACAHLDRVLGWRAGMRPAHRLRRLKPKWKDLVCDRCCWR